MKTRTAVLSLLLAASTLAFVPGAQAVQAVNLNCPETRLDGGVLFTVIVDYDPATNTCHYWLGLVDAYRLCGSLADFEHRQLRQDVTFSGATGAPRTVHVVVNYCAPILYCTCDPIEPAIDPQDFLNSLTASSAAMQPPIYCVMAPCPGPSPPPAITYCTVEALTPGDNPYSTVNPRTLVWGTDEGCDVDVETNWFCIYDEVPVDRTVGPVHVETRVCTVPIPIEPASAAAIGPPVVCVTDPCYPYPFPSVSYCKLEALTPDLQPYVSLNPRTLVWGTDAGCDVDVQSVWACAPPSGQVVDRIVGPVHVAILVCDGGLPQRIGELIAITT